MTWAAPAVRPGMVAIGWRRRPAPLDPAAVLALDGAGASLCRAVAARLPAGDPPEVHAAGRVVLAIGRAEQLPWIDGATWLGWDEGVLVPTTLQATPDAVLVARAARKASPSAGWIVLAPGLRLEGERALDSPDARRLFAIADGLDPR